MTSREPPLSRAQGSAVIAAPPGLVLEHDNCLVALEVILARERADGAVYPEQTITRVGWGTARATLEELVCETFRDPGAPQGNCAARRVLLYEIDALGEIDPRCPLRLERRIAFEDGRREFVEGLVLPFGEAGATDLCTLLHGPSGARASHEAAMGYARALEQRWATACPAGELPVRYLRVDHPTHPPGSPPYDAAVPAAVKRDRTSPPPAQPAAV